MKRLASILVLVLLCTFPACDSSEEGDPSLITGGQGQLIILLTDAPIDMSTVQSVIVTIDEVIVYPTMLTDGGDPSPMVIMTQLETFDLLTLTDGATELLAEAELPVGFYGRIRLRILDAELIFLDGVVEPLKIESGKVDVPIPFELTVGENLEIVLDFDAEGSIQVNQTGSDKYILRPVITPISTS